MRPKNAIEKLFILRKLISFWGALNILLLYKIIEAIVHVVVSWNETENEEKKRQKSN